MAKKKGFKRVNEKSVLFAVFILLAILTIGSLLIVKPKFTGMATFENFTTEGDCVDAGYEWEVVEGSCILNSTCVDSCEADCQVTCEECDDLVIGQECSSITYDNQINCEFNNETWQDVIQQSCILNSTCVDSCEADCQVTCQECDYNCVGALCGDGIVEGDEVCDDGENNAVVCTPAYDDSCSYCNEDCSEEITLTGASCGDGTCDDNEDCSLCLSDCSCNSGYTCANGICEEETPTATTSNDDDSSSDSESETSTVTGDVVAGKSSCVSAWSCGAWGTCINGNQERECTDIYNCATPIDKPVLTQACDSGEAAEPVEEIPAETCSDGIINQDEKGIDCGGICEEKCTIFTIVGNAVNVPFNSSKQFVQENKILSFSFLGVIVLIVSWILVAKFALKKNAFFFLKDFHLPKGFNFFKGKKKTDSYSSNPNS